MPTTQIPRRPGPLARLATIVAVVAVGGVLAACGSEEAASGRNGGSSVKSEVAVATISAAVDQARQKPTGTYKLIQSLRAAGGGNAKVLVTRRGSYDRDRRLHQVLVTAAGQEGAGPIELTFLTTASGALMRNPSFTAQHGRPWTRLPAEALAAAGADPAQMEVEPPGLDVAAAAQEPVRVRAEKPSATEYEVTVPQSAAIELFANVGAVKLAQLTGLSVDDLPASFPGTLPVTLVLRKDGSLSSLEADLRPLIERAVEVATKPIDDFGGVSLLVTLTWSPGDSVNLSVPTPADIGDFPK